jgi:hypothetical protein
VCGRACKRRGCDAYDDAEAESFFSTLQRELLDQRER